jgi:hypothetical protein
MNLIEVKDLSGKCIHFSELEMSKIQADFVWPDNILILSCKHD